jgi:ATP-dependent RNA helicase DeaD
MSDAEFVQIGDMEIDLPPVDLFNINIGRGNKLWALGRLLTIQEQRNGQTIVFTNTKRMVDLIVERLRKCRIEATGLHGDLAQNKREKVLNSFKAAEFATVVATDVAARGLDVEGVTMVVNYDIPNDVDSFIHRIGRTGRAGRRGEAWSFTSRDDAPLLNKIQGTYDLVIPEVETPELPEGVDRDPVKWREDFGELSDVFGMVKIGINVGKEHGLSKLSLLEAVLSAVKMDEMAVGEIYLNQNDSIVCIHKTKVSYVIDGLNGKDIGGQKVSASTSL